MKKITCTICSLIFLLCISGFKSENSNVRALLNECISQMSRITIPAKGKVYHLNMTVTQVPRKKDHTPIKETIEVFLTSNQMICHSGSISMFQDTQDAFVIIHPEKKIIWNKGKVNPDEAVQRKKMSDFQMALLSSSTIRSSREVALNGRKIVVIELKPSDDFAESAGIESLSIRFDKTNKIIQQVEIYFNSQQVLERQTTIYHSLDFNFKKYKESSAFDKVFSSKGQLLPPYQSHQLIKNHNNYSYEK